MVLRETVLLLVIAAFWAVPIAAGVRALITLHRLRTGQEAMYRRLETSERLLQRPTTG